MFFRGTKALFKLQYEKFIKEKNEDESFEHLNRNISVKSRKKQYLMKC